MAVRNLICLRTYKLTDRCSRTPTHSLTSSHRPQITACRSLRHTDLVARVATSGRCAQRLQRNCASLAFGRHLHVAPIKWKWTRRVAQKGSSRSLLFATRLWTGPSCTASNNMPCSALGRSRDLGARVPPEVVDHVVCAMLEACHTFPVIAPFSLACHSFRQIAFRRYFSVLFVYRKAQWAHLCRIPGMFEWVRMLDITTAALIECPQNLQRFTRLSALRVDFSTEGLHTHENYTKLILSNLPVNVYSALTPTTKAKKPVVQQLLELEFCFLPSITPHILTLISVYCPKLQDLILKCTDRLAPECCWTCYEEAASCTIHSPIPDVICDVGDLTRVYGKALAPLAPTLKHLHLGVYLSSVDLFYDHIEHASLPPPGSPAFPFAFLETRPFSPFYCEECQAEGYLVEEVRKTEVLASAQMKMCLPMLERVCWSTWFRRKDDGWCACVEDGKDEDETTVCWVRWVSGVADDGGDNANREVEVRRAPW